MSHTTGTPLPPRSRSSRRRQFRAEAAIEPDPVSTAPVTKTTQIIAIYGKGGIGKSFTLANLSYMMAQQGKKVLLIGCDPKSDTTSLLFGGKACPTIIETSSKKKLAGEAVAIGDVCFKRDGVFAMELGGPEVGRGCGGRGIIHGFETLEARLPRLGLRLRAARLPRRRGLRRLRPADRARHVPEGHRRRQQRPAVAVRGQQRLLGGGVLPQARRQRRRRRHGHQQGRRHRRGCGSRRTPASRCSPRSRPTGHPPQERELRDHRPPGSRVGAAVRDLATNVAEAPPVRPSRRRRTNCSALLRRRGRRATSCSSRRRCSTWSDAARHVRPRSRSSTTTHETRWIR